jgi:hypothetical protein
MLKRLCPVVALLAMLALPTTATASQYVLKHPKHEHCRARYVKKIEKIKVHGHRVAKTVCVYHAPQQSAASPPPEQPTPTPPPAWTPPVPAPAPVKQLEPPYATEVESHFGSTSAYGDLILSFVASVLALEEPHAGSGTMKTQLTTAPVQYKITDTTTGVVEADSSIPSSYGIAGCAIVESFEYPNTTYSGNGAVGCGFSNFTLPDSDNIEVVPSFTGAPGYLPSTGHAWEL